MPIPLGTQTVAMIVGTVLAATGLNLGVLSLDEGIPAVETAEPVSVEPNTSTRPEAPGVPSSTAALTPAAPDVSDASLPTNGQSDDPDRYVPESETGQDQEPEPSDAPTSTNPMPTGSQPTTTAGLPPTAAAPTSTPETQTEYLTYDFTGIATIMVALHDGDRLEFWSVTTNPGWVYRVDDDGPNKVKVKFQRLSDGEEAEFEVKLKGGDLKVKQEA